MCVCVCVSVCVSVPHAGILPGSQCQLPAGLVPVKGGKESSCNGALLYSNFTSSCPHTAIPPFFHSFQAQTQDPYVLTHMDTYARLLTNTKKLEK